MLPTMSVKSKRDYLKKYLTDDKKSHKKKKNKKSENNERKRVKIIDDDVDIINNDENCIDDLILTGEDAPQIVGIIDERPPELRVVEDFQSNGKWKSVPRSNMNAGNNKSPNKFDNYFTENINEIYKKDDNRNSSSQKNNESLKGKHKENRDSNEDLSPRRKNESIKQKHQTDTDSVEDLSSKRKETHEHLSSKQRSYKDSSDDISPKRKRNYEDSSPKRRSYRDSSNDIRPKRKQAHKDLSSKRWNYRDSGDDMSPKRKRTHKDSSLKQQSPRRSRDVDSKQYNIDKDKIKKKNSNLEDLSPDRRRNKGNNERNSSISLERNTLHERKTLDGKSAGLQDARSLKQESEKFRKQENDLFINMSNIISGKDAEVAVRNSSIKHRKDRKNLNKNPEEERKKMELEKEKQDVYSRWGKGLKQIEDYKNKIADEQYEMSKPLARYSNDADLDEVLKKQEREGDPMLEYIRKKDKNKKPNGKIIPIYRGSFPENRFNIRPGYRWDGVDRSNGYEKRWFEAQSKRKALQEELYKYSTEDM